ATGLVGTALVKALVGDGHSVCRLVRRESVAPKKGAKKDSGEPSTDGRVVDVPWDPEASDGLSLADSQGTIAGADAVVNLAGASVADGKWTQQRKMVLRSSRVKTTMALVTALGKLKVKPKVMVSASAIGFYGNRGDETLTEESKAGAGFLPKVCVDWEAEARKAEALGMRVVLTRFGIILAKQGGALPQMMKPFKFFVGGKLGSGRQWMSWVTLEDAIGVIRWALENDGVSGVVNVVSPKPVRNEEFTRELGRAMHRPGVFTAPAFALRMAMGAEMAEEMLLASERVLPGRLKAMGFGFQHEGLGDALAGIL
ncbi:MAG TPA: TIGR01777 family oxidoreductase, partial [Candidatus Acidoferrum sp.]|nr:TIGR01777 family oxidoreductase [Candidatus Acidoferrum sp.]